MSNGKKRSEKRQPTREELDRDYWPCACHRGSGANMQIKLHHKTVKRCRVCEATRPDGYFQKGGE